MSCTLKNSDYRYFEEAHKLALTSEYPCFKIGCVLVYKNKVIGSGVNASKTCPDQKFYNRKYRNFRVGTKPPMDMIHAEIAALRSVPYNVAQEVNWSKVKVYTYRISPGKPSGHGLSRCCPGCLHALKDKGVRKLFYTTDDGFCFETLDD